MPALQAILSEIARLLQREQIPFMVIGGQAVLVHGEPRMTKDIDITLGTDIDALTTVMAIMSEAGLAPLVENPGEFVKRNSVLPMSDSDGMCRVDFIFSFTPYERDAIQRAIKVRIGETDVPYATAEDLIIHKIVAGRPRDLEDVKGILNTKKKVDEQMILRWLKEFSGVVGRDLRSVYLRLQEQ